MSIVRVAVNWQGALTGTALSHARGTETARLYLEGQGYTILYAESNRAVTQLGGLPGQYINKGPDIIALSPAGKLVVVEAKGYAGSTKLGRGNIVRNLKLGRQVALPTTQNSIEWLSLNSERYLGGMTPRDTTESVSVQSNFLFQSANLYRMAGATTEMEQMLHRLYTLPHHPQWSVPERQLHWDLLAMGELMRGDYVATYAYHQPILDLGPLSEMDVPWSTDLAYAMLTHDADRARRIVEQHRAFVQRHHSIKPWSSMYFNLWDWYELADQLTESLA